MGYSSDLIKQVLDKKRVEKRQREAVYIAKLDRALAELPELKALENQRAEVGAKLVAAAMSGDKDALGALQAASKELQKRYNDILKAANVEKEPPACPICKDEGYNGTVLCDCVKAEIREIIKNELTSAAPLGDCDFASFSLEYYPKELDQNGVSPKKRMTAILDFCKGYCEGFGDSADSVLFLGSAGLGKTHLSLAIANEVIGRGYQVIYNTAQNLFLKLEEEYFSHSGNAYADALLECDLLILDDLGTEFCTSFTQSALYNIVNTRILRRKPTIISTNLSLKEIEEKYTARISSRFIGSYVMKKFAGRDVRQLKLGLKND